MKGFGVGLLSAILALPIGAIGLLELGPPVRADVEAPAWQTNLFHFAVRSSVRRRAARVPNPLQHSEAELIAGGKLYLDGCAGCHGRPGRPARAQASVLGIPEFAHVDIPYSDAEAFWIVRHGIRRTGMSAYGSFYSEPQTWTLVEFIRHMKNLPASVRDAIQAQH